MNEPLNANQMRWITQAATTDGVVDQAQVEAMVKRYEAGEPLQYVLGRWAFRDLDLLVDKRVLIPRPETEQVVEAAVSLIHDGATVVDLGTGSGAIAISIATERNVTVHATDASADALEVARINAAQTNVTFHLGSWFEALPSELKGKVDVIVTNPPYVAENDAVDTVVREYEPHSALYAGTDGLDDIRIILKEAPQWLNSGGHIVVELGPDQAETARELALEFGFESVSIGQDFAGRNRWIAAHK